MAMKQTPSSPSSQSVLSAWQAQLQVAQDPHLKQQLLQRQGELLPRFAEHYQKLSSLPRRMRRSLQRKWKQSLAGVVVLLALNQGPTMTAIINVGGTRSLERAITSANNDTQTLAVSIAPHMGQPVCPPSQCHYYRWQWKRNPAALNRT
jgi:hypothetical protein